MGWVGHRANSEPSRRLQNKSNEKKGKLPGLLTTMGPSGFIVYGSVMGITFLLLP
jgi:hypothetical protein